MIKNIHIFGVGVLEDQCLSDHFPVLFEWHMRVSHQANINLYGDFSLIKTPESITFLNQILIGELKLFQIDGDGAEGSFKRLFCTCFEVLSHSFSSKEKRSKYVKPGWITKTVKNSQVSQEEFFYIDNGKKIHRV